MSFCEEKVQEKCLSKTQTFNDNRCRNLLEDIIQNHFQDTLKRRDWKHVIINYPHIRVRYTYMCNTLFMKIFWNGKISANSKKNIEKLWSRDKVRFDKNRKCVKVKSGRELTVYAIQKKEFLFGPNRADEWKNLPLP